MKTNQNQIVKIIGMIILVSGCSPKVKTLDPTAATTASVSATPTPASTIFGDLMASMGFRTDNSSVDLTSQAAVDARIRALISDEASGTFVTKGNSLVPNPLFDSDGRYNADGDGAGATGVPEKRNYLETVKGGRPAKVCGLTGTIDERIANCALVANNGAKATYEGAKYGYAVELICSFYGEILPNEHWTGISLSRAETINDSLLESGVSAETFSIFGHLFYRGSPVEIPEIDDFPCIGYVTLSEMPDALAALTDNQLSLIKSDDGEEIRVALKQVRDWLEACQRDKTDLVCFYY